MSLSPAVKAEMKDVLRGLSREVGIFAGAFAVASLVGALIWNAVVDLPLMTQAGSGRSTVVLAYAVQAIKTISIDAGYLFVSAPLALLLGAVLAYWRRRTPVRTVVLIALVSVCAAALMERFGLWIGPANPADVLEHAKVLTNAPVQLKVQATGVLLVWPAAALLGSLLVLLLAPASKFEEPLSLEREIADEAVELPN
ncbi:MAG TPA: hypothetical protein VN108_06565 [Marmoricola sp.]|nr:hypothetical protein [Marmoricola sp.]